MKIRIRIIVIVFLLSWLLTSAAAHAWVFLTPVAAGAGTVGVRVLATGAGRAFVAGGTRMIPVLIEVIKTGSITAGRRAWVSVAKTQHDRAGLLAKTLIGGSAAVAAFEYGDDAYDLLSSLAAREGWVPGVEPGTYATPGQPSGDLVFSDPRAWEYNMNVYLPVVLGGNYAPPHTIHSGGIYATDAAASAAADAKRAEFIADPGATATTKSQSTPYAVADGVNDTAARVKVYMVGRIENGTGLREWWLFGAPYSSSTTQTVPAAGTPAEPVTATRLAEAILAAAGASGVLSTQIDDLYTKLENKMVATHAEAVGNPGQTVADNPPLAPPYPLFPTHTGVPNIPRLWDDYIIPGIPEIEDIWDGGEPIPIDAPVFNPVPPPPPVPADPTGNTSCTAQRFSQFLSTMQSSSIGSLWTNFFGGVPSSQQCQMSVNLGTTFGGSQTVDFCGWASWLAYVKAALLVVAAFVAVRIIMINKGG